MLRFRFARGDFAGDRIAGRTGSRPRTGYAVVIVGGGLHGLGTAQALLERHGVSDVAVLGAEGTVGDPASALLRLDGASSALIDLYRAAGPRWRRFAAIRRPRPLRPDGGHITLAHGEAAAADLRFQSNLASLAGLRRRALDREDIRRRCGGLDMLDGTHLAVVEAVHQPDSTVLPVADALRWTARSAVRRGVQLLSGTVPLRLRTNAGRITGIETSHGVIHADRILLTDPCQTTRLAADLGMPLPIAVQWVDRATTMPVAPWLTPSVASRDLGVELWQDDDGAVTMLGRDAAARAVALFPALAAATIASLRRVPVEVSPDGLPLVGSWGPEGLMISAGWAAAAAWAAPIAADILSDAIVGDAKRGRAATFMPDRLAGPARVASAA